VLVREENFEMIHQVVLVLCSTFIFSLAAELHCKLQLKQIAKPKTAKALFVHYLITVVFLGFSLLSAGIYWHAYSSLGLPQSQKILFLLVSGVVFIAPSLVITTWRYPSIVEKMEEWRKN
jgi:uncharacterized membrane protein YbhN (UPF0104 family)